MTLPALYAAHIKHLDAAYQVALETSGFDAVLVHAGRLERKSSFDDQDWPFRAVPTFEHWADIEWPDSAIVVRQGAAPVLVAHANLSFWEKPKAPDWDLLKAGLHVETITTFEGLKPHCTSGKVAFIGHSQAAAADLGISPEAFNPIALVEALEAIRTTKTPYEVQCLFEASERAAHGHRCVAQGFMAGIRSELDLHLTYLMASQQDDAQCPYKNIVALGASGSVLHHVTYGDSPEAQSLLIDAGARSRGYASDVTRTHVGPQRDEAAERFADLIAGMETLKTEVIAKIVPGEPYEAMHDYAHDLLGGLLVQSGLAKVSAEACTQSGLTRVLFPHGLGHSLGIQVHDVGMRKTDPRTDNRYLRNTSTIAEGQVFTIEPGLYFIESLLAEAKAGAHADALDWDLVDQLRPFGGIRLEDNILVLADGVRNLTAEAFAKTEAE